MSEQTTNAPSTHERIGQHGPNVVKPDLSAPYPGLNFMRAVGAIMVMTTHVAFDTGQIMEGWTGAVLARFDFGVTIFFVLSGFLLSRPFLISAAYGRSAPDTKHYLWKRFLRVMPLYWLMVVAAMLLEPENKQIAASDWFANLTLTQLYTAGLLPSGLSQMWSLATEAAFYVVLPFLMALLLGRARRFDERRILLGLLLISVLGTVWQMFVAPIPGEEGHFAQWLFGYLSWFCAGIAFATVSVGDSLKDRDHFLKRWSTDPIACWVIAALIFAIAATPISGERNLLSPVSWEAGTKSVLYVLSASFLIMPLIFGDQKTGIVHRVCNHPIPFFLGEISYGIFCVHVLVMKQVFRSADFGIFQGHFAEVWFTTAGITLVLSIILYYSIERPALRLKSWGPFGSSARRAKTKPAATSQ